MGPVVIRVLVVDDDRDALFLIRLILQRAGFEVHEAVHGQEALARLGEVDVDAVVTDLMMPVMDGRELIARIRQDPDMASIPILLVSAHVEGKVPADRIMSKPFGPDALVDAVTELVHAS